MQSTGLPALACLLVTGIYAFRCHHYRTEEVTKGRYRMTVILGLLVSGWVLVLEPLVLEQINRANHPPKLRKAL
jgi:hypothetical protein